MRRRAVLIAALLPLPVHAHGQFAAIGPFWSGALHFLISPLALATVVGLVMAFAAVREEHVLWSTCIAAAAAVLAARFAPQLPPLLTAAGAVSGGLVAASGRHPGKVPAALIAVVAGAGAGRATELDAILWSSAIGVGFATGYCALLGMVGCRALGSLPRLAEVLTIGRRALGAWVAAIGLLLGTLAIHGVKAAS